VRYTYCNTLTANVNYNDENAKREGGGGRRVRKNPSRAELPRVV